MNISAESTNGIGRQISELLKQRKLTQAELAERVGVTPAAMNRYIKGVREPKMVTLTRIASELAVPVQSLISNSTDASNLPLQDAVEIVARQSNELTQAQRDVIIDALFRKKPQ